jgi:hemoglobin
VTGETEQATLYEAAGGMPFFEDLVGRFYAHVAEDDLLLTVYRKADLDGACHRLTLFLAEYWGGPATYSAERGHPRLRMRHFPFDIGPEKRDRWLAHMRAALEEVAPAPAPGVKAALLQYFEMGAEALRAHD